MILHELESSDHIPTEQSLLKIEKQDGGCHWLIQFPSPRPIQSAIRYSSVVDQLLYILKLYNEQEYKAFELSDQRQDPPFYLSSKSN